MPKAIEWSKDVALELLKAGFFSLAKKYHPDHGGNHEKFLVLQATKEYLDGLMNGRAKPQEPPRQERPKPPPRHEHRHDDSERPANIEKYAHGWWTIASVEVIRTSEKAIQVIGEDDSVPFWLPKSQLHRSANEVWEAGDEGRLVFSDWIASQKGWI
jgi:hypothetical protein